MAHTPWVIIRLYIGGELVDKTTLSWGRAGGLHDVLGLLGIRHGQLAKEASDRGEPYLIEFEFDDGEHVRWGTDLAGIVIPLQVGLSELVEYFERRGEGGE